MQRRVRLFVLCLVWAASAVFWCGSAAAVQPRSEIRFTVDASTSGVATASDGEIAAMLHQGQALEQQRRWGEAVAHYENAIRKYPYDALLRQRFGNARTHYDIERRYLDRSFRDSVDRMSIPRALELYAQVLLKIESHYVDLPRWKDLLDRGTADLDVALGERTFVERNVPPHRRPAVDGFRRELRAMLDPLAIDTRAAAREAVAAAAQLAQRRLEIGSSAVVLEYLCGAANSLDSYSAYLTPDQLNEVYATIEGNFVGLGVELKAQGGVLAIVRVITGSPADEAGLRAGDQILSVDGRSTNDITTDQAANMLQGAEGSVAELAVATPGRPTRLVSVRRRRVEVPSVDQVGIVDPQYGIGYFKLTCFQKTTARDLDAALWKLHREGMKSLVIDVRDNPGGLLISAVESVDRFIERGIIVSTRGRNTQEDFTYKAHEQAKWTMPLVVVIDENSASAAEIFAGAIRDHRRGTIVGAKSFGKGSVQGIFPLEESTSGIRLTTSKFYSPNGLEYNHRGVEPDVAVRVAARPVNGRIPEDGNDAMLAAALEIARSGLSPAFQARSVSQPVESSR